MAPKASFPGASQCPSSHLTVPYTIISLQHDVQGPLGTCHRLEAVRGSSQANLCVHPHTGNYDLIPMAAVTFSICIGVACKPEAGSAVSRKPEQNPLQTSLSHLHFSGTNKGCRFDDIPKMTRYIYMYNMIHAYTYVCVYIHIYMYHTAKWDGPLLSPSTSSFPSAIFHLFVALW